MVRQSSNGIVICIIFYRVDSLDRGMIQPMGRIEQATKDFIVLVKMAHENSVIFSFNSFRFWLAIGNHDCKK